MPLLVVFIPLGMICPYFGDDGVLVFVVFDGHREAHALLYRVLDLVELLPHVVGGVVLGARGRGAVVAALFPPAPHAPQQEENQHEDPNADKDGAEEGHKVVWWQRRGRKVTRSRRRTHAFTTNQHGGVGGGGYYRTAGGLLLPVQPNLPAEAVTAVCCRCADEWGTHAGARSSRSGVATLLPSH